VEHDVPASVLIEINREIDILCLGFLDQQYIGTACFQIIQNMV